MTTNRKNTLDNTIAIPVLPMAVVAAFCLWNMVFFIFVIPDDGMALIPKDGIIVEDYPHIVNAFIAGITWGVSTSLFLFVAVRYMPVFVIVALHIGGIVCVAAFIYQTTVHVTCQLPFCA